MPPAVVGGSVARTDAQVPASMHRSAGTGVYRSFVSLALILVWKHGWKLPFA